MRYSPKFEQAVETVLRQEGGYVNDPQDAGGETNYGISKRSYPHLDIKGLTREKAAAIYHRDWWAKYDYGKIRDVEVATKILSLAVNMNTRAAHRIVQRALRACHRPVKVDGALGPKTRRAINQIPAAMFLPAIRSEAAGHYRLIIAKKQAHPKFLRGWLRRAYE